MHNYSKPFSASIFAMSFNLHFQIPYLLILIQWRSYNGTACGVLLVLTHEVNAHLMRKYDIHFNFFLTKPITEVVYNQTYAPTTIAFKDAALLADTNEYLKRYYFLRNALDKDEIFDRVRLLACTLFKIQSSTGAQLSLGTSIR